MRVADYILGYLSDLGVQTVFGVTGAAIADLIDAFTRTDRIRYVAMQHEQTAAFAAEGLAKTAGGLAVAVATSGPGGINLLTGVANCWYDSVPALFITGQINSKFLKSSFRLRQVGFQENDIVAMAKPITKYAIQVREAKDIRVILDRLVYLAMTGRPGPVLLDIPVDVLKQDVDPALLKGSDMVEPRLPDVSAVVGEYLDALEQAERPVLLIGGGVRSAGAGELVRELGRVLGVPCLPTWNAVDVIASDYEMYRGRIGTYGGPGRNFAIQNADLLLAIGCRFSGRITGGVVESFARQARRFVVDVDPALLDPALQTVRGDVNVQCDAWHFVAMLLDAARARSLKRFDDWLARTAEWRDRYDPALDRPVSETVDPYTFVAELARQLAPADVIVSDCGGNTVVVHQAFQTKVGQRLFSSHGNSPMGFALAGAIGAAFAPGVHQVVCLIGDGGLQLNIQELQTIRQYKLPIKVFVFDNQSYGIIKAYQDTNLGGRYTGSGPDGYGVPDLIRICHAYKVKAGPVGREHMAADIAFILSRPGPLVGVVNMAGHWQYEPRIFGWQTPIEDMYPYLPRDEFRANMAIEPLDGWETPAMPGGARHA